MPSQDRMNMDKSDRVLYDKLAEEPLLRGTTRKEQFLLAMATGFVHNRRIELGPKEGLFLLKDLHSDEEALLSAVALSLSEDASVVADRSVVLKTAEEFAHAGLQLLLSQIESTEFGTFDKHFEKDLLERLSQA